jgi:hypothetical protein
MTAAMLAARTGHAIYIILADVGMMVFTPLCTDWEI